MESTIKRIAFISDHASPLALLGGVDTGGQNVYVAQLALQLAELNYQVDIFTRREEIKIKEIIDWKPGIRVIHVTAGPAAVLAKEELLPFMAEFGHNLAAFIRRQRLTYELIHAHFFMSALVAMGIKKDFGVPFVVTFHALGFVRGLHQGENDRFPAERLQIEARAIAEADRVIAECPQDMEDLVNYYHADRKRIEIVPCGFNPEEFYPVDRRVARRMLQLPEQAPILLQLGRMVPRKGIDTVIRALACLNAGAESAFKLLIVGGKTEQLASADCPEYRRLSELAERLGVQKDVIFAGRKSRSELKLYYAAADIFITTPWYEPFGITPLESMACGTPVIGASVGGIKHSVADGHTGLLVPPKDPVALKAAIRKMSLDHAFWQRCGKNGIKRVHALFTWKKVAQSMEMVYKEVICNSEKTQQNEIKAA